jgi:ADP-ribose pyrophosphatase YjhB (NUDIX family)
VTHAEVAAGAIVLRDDAVLLVRRGRPPGAGQWSVPGGRVDFGETVRAAVAREVREETGLDVEVGAFAGWVERIDGGHHFVILDFFATVRAGSADAVAGDDAAEVRWVPLSDVATFDLVDGLLDFLREIGSLRK